MSAGPSYDQARRQAQANANLNGRSRWLHAHDGVYWISKTPVVNSTEIMPTPGPIVVLGKIVDLMRATGVNINSLHDFDNWMEDHADHQQLFATGRFKTSGDRY